MSQWTIEPPPPTRLGRYRQFSPRAGIHVSPIVLGAMSIGDQWEKYGMGAMDKRLSFKLLDAYYGAGGNFIDTASNYQDGTSETFIGEWMETRGIRDQIVLATKYSTNIRRGREDVKQKVAFQGNNLKTMHITIEESLKKLRTDYVDIFYLHWWDGHSSVEEIMDGLHTLVISRKVLYLGVSDAPAWFVSKANMYAKAYGKTPFVVYQGAWSILQRDFEREILPMCIHEGLAICPWNVLAGGHIRSNAEEERRRDSGEKGRELTHAWERTAEEKEVCDVIERIAAELGAKNMGSVAIAYILQKAPFVFPVIGGRKVEHLKSNLEALEITLTPEHVAELEGVLHLDLGFPHTMLGALGDYSWFMKMNATLDPVPLRSAIQPAPQ